MALIDLHLVLSSMDHATITINVSGYQIEKIIDDK